MWLLNLYHQNTNDTLLMQFINDKIIIKCCFTIRNLKNETPEERFRERKI